jgi:nucleolar protein 56
MAKVLLLELGIIALEDGKIVKSIPFDINNIIKEFMDVKNGRYNLSELSDLGIVYINDESLTVIKEYIKDVKMMSNEEILKIIEDKLDLIVRARFANSKDEAKSLLRDFAIRFSELKIREASTRRDLHIIQAINALDEYDKYINILSERTREWYGLHFPELASVVENINTYCDIVLIGDRKDITTEVLNNLGLDEKKINKIIDLSLNSKGGEITSDNINILRSIAKDLKTLIKVREAISNYIEKEMESIAPNIKELVGANIGARLIAKVNGLDKLASLPASTIQVLGAEKALFRALKSKTKPPKHGIIFQHTLIHSAPKWQRGKIARALASNLALAARLDYYKGVKDPELLTRLNHRIDEIRIKYKEMPKKEEVIKPKKETRFNEVKKFKKVKKFARKRR